VIRLKQRIPKSSKKFVSAPAPAKAQPAREFEPSGSKKEETPKVVSPAKKEEAPAKKEESIDNLEKMLKNPSGISFPKDAKDIKAKVSYLENLKKQFEEA